MNMNIPGFTAESALYKSKAVYALAAGWVTQSDTCVVPAAESQFEISRQLQLGGILYQTPLEFGTPVSLIGSVSALGGPFGKCCSSCSTGDTNCLSNCSNC